MNTNHTYSEVSKNFAVHFFFKEIFPFYMALLEKMYTFIDFQKNSTYTLFYLHKLLETARLMISVKSSHLHD